MVFLISAIYFFLGFVLTENNAKYLLAGYNTMGEEDQKKFNIKKMVSFLKKSFWLLGVVTILVGIVLILLNKTDSDIVGVITFISVLWVVYSAVEIRKPKYKN